MTKTGRLDVFPYGPIESGPSEPKNGGCIGVAKNADFRAKNETSQLNARI